MSAARPRSGFAEPQIRPWGLVVAALLGVGVALAPIHLEPRAHSTLVVLVVAAGLWVSEAVPVAWTALLIPSLAVLLRIADPKAAFAGFGDPILFLFFGTFLLTSAAFEHGLQARLTRAVLGAKRIQTHPQRLLWAISILGCVVSAWVNNTATTALLLPLALTAEGRVSRLLFRGVLLMTAYAPSLGGIATPVGTAPNLIGLRLLETATGTRISFAHWTAMFAPLAVLFTILAATAFMLRARLSPEHEPAPASAHDHVAIAAENRPWSLAEKTLLPLYGLVILLWILPGILAATRLREAPWLATWAARLPETCVPLLGGLALFLLPSGRRDALGRRSRILDAGVLARLDWSTLLLFGGGLSLGGMMFETGLARALGDWIFAHVPIHGELGIVVAATLLGVLVSEVTSNTASTSLVVPVVLALAQSAGVDPVKPAIAATVGCSFGFMLPVSTPPNALVYATGRLRIGELVRCGIGLDLAGVAIVAGWVWLVG